MVLQKGTIVDFSPNKYATFSRLPGILWKPIRLPAWTGCGTSFGSFGRALHHSDFGKRMPMRRAKAMSSSDNTVGLPDRCSTVAVGSPLVDLPGTAPNDWRRALGFPIGPKGFHVGDLLLPLCGVFLQVFAGRTSRAAMAPTTTFRSSIFISNNFTLAWRVGASIVPCVAAIKDFVYRPCRVIPMTRARKAVALGDFISIERW